MHSINYYLPFSTSLYRSIKTETSTSVYAINVPIDSISTKESMSRRAASKPLKYKIKNIYYYGAK